MTLRDSIDRFLFGPPPAAISAPVNRAGAPPPQLRGDYDRNRFPDWIITGRNADWSLWDNDRIRVDAVRKCVTVFACATILADAVAEANLEVQEKDADRWVKSDDIVAELLQSVLVRPNPYMEDAEFWGLLVMQQATQGYAVVEKVRRPDGLVVELWPLRPDRLRERRIGNEPTTYEYVIPGKPPRPIPADDLIFLPWRHDDLLVRRGVGPVQIAMREIGIDSTLTDFLLRFLQNGGVPPFVLITEELIEDDSTITKIQTDWKQKYGGSAAAEELPVLHGGMALEKVGDGIGDMAWPDLRELTELKICSAFRVPAGLVQARAALIGGSLTTTESDGDMTTLQRYGAEPLRIRNAAAIGRDLLEEFGLDYDRYRLWFDTSGILALQEDTDAVHVRARNLWNDSIITQNQTLQMIGMDEVTGGDVYKVGFASLFVSVAGGGLAGADAGDPGANSAPKPAAIRQRAFTALPARAVEPSLFVRATGPLRYRSIETMSVEELEVRASFAARIRKDRTKLVQIGTRQLRKFWKEQGARIADAYEKAGDQPDVLKSEADIFWGDETEKLADVLQRYYHSIGEAAFAAASDSIGDTIGWDVTNPRILSLQDQLGDRITRIGERTRRDVIKEITAGTQEGQGTAQIAERIRGLFTETYKNRAEAVARTETQVAYNRSSVLAYAESGAVKESELLDNPDHDEEYGAADGLTCAERDGLVVDLADVDIHILGEHPNGSLIVTPILATPLGEE